MKGQYQQDHRLAACLLGRTSAQATPTGPPPAAPRSVGSRTEVSLSKTEWSAAKYVTKARNKAVNVKGSSMDYAKMKDIFGRNKTRVDWRRQSAAGFKQAGGKITNISMAEAKTVEKRRKQIYGSASPLKVAGATASAEKSTCKGKSGNIVINANETHEYFNSCQTIDLAAGSTACVSAMRFLARFTAEDKRVDVPRY